MEGEPEGLLAGALKVAAGAVAGATTLILGLWKVRSRDKKALADEVTENLKTLLAEMRESNRQAVRKADRAERRADEAEKKADESDRKHEECKADRERLWSQVAMLRQRLGIKADEPPRESAG